jgi:hypothetical protein
MKGRPNDCLPSSGKGPENRWACGLLNEVVISLDRIAWNVRTINA